MTWVLDSSEQIMIYLPLRSKVAVLLAVLGGFLSTVPSDRGEQGFVSLSVKLSKAQDHLIVHYVMRNVNSAAIYVWDVLPNNAHEEEVLDPELAYVFWEAPRTVRIVRAILDEPPDLHPVVRELPFVHKVLAHSSLQGRISLALPVQEYSPFYPPAAQSKLAHCDNLHLIIGWIEHQKGMVVSEREVGGQPALALRGSWPRPAQHLLNAKLTASLDLSVRQDDFDRRPPPQ